MSRVIHYRLYELPAERLERLEGQFASLATARQWRSEPPWLATAQSRQLFQIEYFANLRDIEGPSVAGGGFLKLRGDETDALILVLFLRDLSAEYQIRISLRDDSHPLAKLRHLEFQAGRLASGQALEDVLARRPIIKKVQGQAILFYPPSFRLHSQAPPGSGQWGYALCGLRAFAPSLLEAEQEALKILRGLRRLGR
jgi:hypothetical protein